MLEIVASSPGFTSLGRTLRSFSAFRTGLSIQSLYNSSCDSYPGCIRQCLETLTSPPSPLTQGEGPPAVLILKKKLNYFIISLSIVLHCAYKYK